MRGRIEAQTASHLACLPGGKTWTTLDNCQRWIFARPPFGQKSRQRDGMLPLECHRVRTTRLSSYTIYLHNPKIEHNSSSSKSTSRFTSMVTQEKQNESHRG
jgi:hypothetical protein